MAYSKSLTHFTSPTRATPSTTEATIADWPTDSHYPYKTYNIFYLSGVQRVTGSPLPHILPLQHPAAYSSPNCQRLTRRGGAP